LCLTVLYWNNLWDRYLPVQRRSFDRDTDADRRAPRIEKIAEQAETDEKSLNSLMK
jgi:hypothetical protein